MNTLIADARFALRTLKKSPTFVIVTVLTVAFGIGGNVAIATLVNAVMLSPLPFSDPHRLVRVFDDAPKAGAKDVGMSVPEFLDLKDSSGVFEELSAIFPASTALSGGDRVERVELLGTSPNYFELLGAKAAVGRTYGKADAQPGFFDGVVISDALWRRQFGADPRVIGRRIRVDEDSYSVIGVMPPGFRHPGNTVNGDVDIWASAGFVAAPFPSPPIRGARVLPGAIGRLSRGMSIEMAQRRLSDIANRLKQAYPNDYPKEQGWTLRVQEAEDSMVSSIRPTLVLLLGATAVVLLIVTVNVSSLFLARSAARTTEFAIRQAVGATRDRLARLVLTESLLISTTGAIVAVTALVVAQRTLIALVPENIPRLPEVRIDWRTIVLAFVLSVVTGTLCGFMSGMRATEIDAVRALREGGRSGGGTGARHRKARAALVSLEVALSVVLLSATGVLVRSFVEVLRQDPGFSTKNLVVGQIWVPVPNDPNANKYLTVPQRAALDRRVLDQIASVPGVDAYAVGASWDIPMLGTPANALPFSMPDEASSGADDHAAVFDVVSAGYFNALKMSVKRGRVFTDHDDDHAPNVVVVNEAFVRRFSSSSDPIGKRVRVNRAGDFQIVGVVGDSRNDGLDTPPVPHIYHSILQRPTTAIAMFIRTRLDGRSAKDALTLAVHIVDPELPVFGVRTMNEMMASSLARRRFALSLMSVFALSAAVLAALGIYGVISFLVSQRTQEFGVRRALGASRRDILAVVLRPGIWMIARGTIAGLVAALFTTRLLASLVFGVSTGDPATLIGVSLSLGFVGIVACLVPALRAARVSPMQALNP